VLDCALVLLPDCICEIAFGQNIDTLAKESTFAKAFDQSQYIATKRFFAPPVIFKLMRVR